MVETKFFLYLSFLLLFLFSSSIHSKKIIRTVAGIPPFGGDGKLAQYAFVSQPMGVVINSKGEVLFTDSENHIIRKVDKNGIISTFAGIPGINGYSGDFGIATNASLNLPMGISIHPLTNEIYFTDSFNNAIRKISTNGIISTIAGQAEYGKSGDGGPATLATLNFPNHVFVTFTDEIYICDTYNHAIRKIFINGTISTVAGLLGMAGYSGDGGVATNAKLNGPASIHVNAKNEMYIADTFNNVIRKVFSNGTIVTAMGVQHTKSKDCGWTNSTNAKETLFCLPRGVFLVEETNELYISDSMNCLVRRVSLQNETIETVAGQYNECAYAGDEKQLDSTKLRRPVGLFVSPVNPQQVYIADRYNNVIRKMDILNGVMKLVAGYNANNEMMVSTKYKNMPLHAPNAILVTSKNELYIADSSNFLIKKVNFDKHGEALNVEIIAGQKGNSQYVGDGIPAVESTLFAPMSIALNENTQEMIIADTYNHLIRKIDKQGIISILAGNRNGISNGTLATEVQLSTPRGLFWDQKDNELYIADTENHVIRKVFLNDNGTIVTIAGTIGVKGFNESCLSHPGAIHVTEDKQVYIADAGNRSIRQLMPNGTMIALISKHGDFIQDEPPLNSILVHGEYIYYGKFGSIKRVFKNGTGDIENLVGDLDNAGFSGENNDPLEARMYAAGGMFITPNGAFYFSDYNNNVVRKINDLCSNYSIHFNASISSTNLLVSPQRSCVADSGYFEVDYLPLVELNYKSTEIDLTTIVADWNQQQNFSVNLKSQNLDLISIQLNGCNEKYGISSNCSQTMEYGIIPTSDVHNFLLLPSITSMTFINFYRISPLVSSIQILLQFINTKTQQIDKTVEVFTPLKSSSIEGLQHSTRYLIEIDTTVVYSNGMTFSSTPTTTFVETLVGILPSSSVQSIEVLQQDKSLVVTWQGIPLDKRGNMPVYGLELEITTGGSKQESSIIHIIYNADENNPNSYPLSSVISNMQYTFRIRACSEIGCSAFSNPTSITTPGGQAISNTILTASIGLSILVGFICIISLIGLVVILLLFIGVFILMKRKAKRDISYKRQQDEIGSEMLEEMVSKEFRIDESKIDLKGSRFIGSGVSGSVVTAKYYNIDVAVKLIQKRTNGIETDLKDFYNELQFLNSNSQHSNIIRFFGVYENTKRNHIGMVMELCNNGNLANYVSQHQHLSFEQKLSFIKGIAHGMKYLHFHNIAHRDLKCENVLLDDQLTPKIIDFGYSRVISEEVRKSMNLTMNIGTAVYCAPEVINNNLSDELNISPKTTLAYDKKCDVYSFAIVMWVIYFQNKNPYGENSNTSQILLHIASNANTRPKTDVTTLPPNEHWLIDLMKQCWSTNPESRPTFEQICAELEKHHY